MVPIYYQNNILKEIIKERVVKAHRCTFLYVIYESKIKHGQ